MQRPSLEGKTELDEAIEHGHHELASFLLTKDQSIL